MPRRREGANLLAREQRLEELFVRPLGRVDLRQAI